MNRHVDEAVRDKDGKRVWQGCYICKKKVDIQGDRLGDRFVSIGKFVRHRRCLPPPLK